MSEVSGHCFAFSVCALDRQFFYVIIKQKLLMDFKVGRNLYVWHYNVSLPLSFFLLSGITSIQSYTVCFLELQKLTLKQFRIVCAPGSVILILHHTHVVFLSKSVANARNPMRYRGGTYSIKKVSHVDVRQAIGLQGILLGLLSTLSFINLINDVYWGMLHSNQQLCREWLSAVKDVLLLPTRFSPHCLQMIS